MRQPSPTVLVLDLMMRCPDCGDRWPHWDWWNANAWDWEADTWDASAAGCTKHRSAALREKDREALWAKTGKGRGLNQDWGGSW